MTSSKVKYSETNIPAANNSAEDQSMPNQSGGNQSNGGEGGTDTFNKFLTNEKKYGGKPPGDESIANRGVPKQKISKD